MLKPYYLKNGIEVGIDEVGRGSLVGPVISAAVILPKNFTNKNIRDSKKIPKKKHKDLSSEIKKHAIAWAIGEATKSEIEKYNVLKATYLAMHRAIAKIIDKHDLSPTRLLVDGNSFQPYPSIENICFIKGDAKFYSIAAASILAKYYRDQLLKSWHQIYPLYGWDSNAGYATKQHISAICKYGITPLHRKTYKQIKNIKK